MDFKQIEAFAGVLTYGSFSKAADALFLTQPTISMHVSALEKELGRQLCIRQGKQILPTREGEILYQYAVSMMNIREKAILSLQDFSRNAEGVLEIQASSIPGEYILPQILATFREKHPKVRYYLEQSDSAQACENVLAHKGELGVVGSRSSPGLHYDLLLRDEPVLITPDRERFRKMQGKPFSLRDVAEEPFILREQGSGTREEFEKHVKNVGLSIDEMTVVAKLNSIEAIKQAVAFGLGVSIISKIAAEQRFGTGAYLAFPMEECGKSREFYMVHDPCVPLSPAAELFKTFTLEQRNNLFST